MHVVLDFSTVTILTLQAKLKDLLTDRHYDITLFQLYQLVSIICIIQLFII